MLNQDSRNTLLRLLSQYFDRVQLEISNTIDARAYVSNTQQAFYVVYQPEEPSDVQLKNLYKEIDKQPNSNQVLQLTILIVTQLNGNFAFAIMAYNEYGRCYLNKHISWRYFANPDDLEWLKQQLQIKRNHITLLPENMWKIKKTIYLNDEEINEGEIVYFRSLSLDYKMNTPQDQTEEQRFMRIINGTPEEEYPKDKLDDVIYKRIVNLFPHAEVKSDTFLFTTDLANLRIKKEKQLHQFYLCFLPVTYRDQWQPIVDDQNRVDISMELYYYPNIFGKNYNLPQHQIVQIDTELQPIINRQKNTYLPLSALNI